MADDDVLSGPVLEGGCLTLAELCAVCSIEAEWVVRRVDEGLFPATDGAPQDWRFGVAGIARARRMVSIERDFDAVPELAALVADLLEEIDGLRGQLRARASRRG